MTTITTTVPFAVKEQHMDIQLLVRKYVNYMMKQNKNTDAREIGFGKKGTNAKEILSYLKKIHD